MKLTRNEVKKEVDIPHPKWLYWLDHLWPYISGMLLVMLAGARLIWYKLTHHYVTKDELAQCRNDVRHTDGQMMEKLDHMIEENARQHQDIMKQIIRLHK